MSIRDHPTYTRQVTVRDVVQHVRTLQVEIDVARPFRTRTLQCRVFFVGKFGHADVLDRIRRGPDRARRRCVVLPAHTNAIQHLTHIRLRIAKTPYWVAGGIVQRSIRCRHSCTELLSHSLPPEQSVPPGSSGDT